MNLLDCANINAFSNLELGRWLWENYRSFSIANLGHDVEKLSDEDLGRFKETAKLVDTRMADNGLLVLAVRAAAMDDLEKAGEYLRAHLLRSAVIKKALQPGLDRLMQIKNAFEPEIEEKRKIGARNREAVRVARDRYLSTLGNAKRPSNNQIAKAIATSVNLSIDATGRHLSALDKGK